MDEQRRGPGDLPTGERVATLAGAVTNAAPHKARGEHETEHGARLTMPPAEAEAIIGRWPEAPPPKLFWCRAGPWRRILVTSDVLVHNFPAPHSDYLTQWIEYQVPVGLVDEIPRYDGSCLADRLAGEAGARCDSEAANTITLNLVHEIVGAKRTMEEAREVYAENVAGCTIRCHAAHAERLLFAVPQGGTEFPDEWMGMSPIVRQAAGRVTDILTGREHEPTDRQAAASGRASRAIAGTSRASEGRGPCGRLP